MATAAMSLLHFTRIPRHVSLFPYLHPHRSSSSSLKFTRTCKPRVSLTFFPKHFSRRYSVTASTSSDWNNVATGDETYDVIVVGGGHAGCEAALASARLGSKTLLLTLSIDRIAWQPCNPAVGGHAKSQLVHEVYALGGEIGKIADRCYLQKRVLNISRGPAIRALRAQTDKREYAIEITTLINHGQQHQK